MQYLSMKKMWFLAYLIYIATISFVVGVEYQVSLFSKIQEVDEKIEIAIKNIKYVLPRDYHDKKVSPKEYREVTHLLTRLSQENGFKYFYTMVLKKGKDLYETSSSELSQQDSPRYYSLYKNPEPELIRLLMDKNAKKAFFDLAYEGKQMQRVGCVREVSLRGKPFLACADYDMKTVRQKLRISSIRRLVYYFLLLLCVYPFIWAYKESSKERQKQLEHDVRCRTAELGFALKSAERANETKSNFLASMSHELRTPLNAIIGFSEAMKEEAFGPIENKIYKEYAAHISTSGTHLLSLINDILDLSKLEANQEKIRAEWIDINDLIKECLSIVEGYPTALEKKLVFSKEEMPKIYVDPRMIKQVLLNLLSNSIKFTKEKKGIIRVFVYISKNEELCFGVEDNGIGIPKDKLDHIFEPFAQVENVMTKQHQGTGLGLSLVKQIVRYHKGDIKIESVLDKGTKISIFLPKEVFIGSKKAKTQEK
ncbi:MAG: HAMP domain-containing histidine kinase [Alphaproteobacteria bacterium]|nr:HAMP domain-containing histidine kinase [Alphaproteobacteria bacterium]